MCDLRNREAYDVEIESDEVKIRQAITEIVEGRVTKEAMKVLEMSALRLKGAPYACSKRQFESVASIFPYQQFLDIALSSTGLLHNYAVVIFSLYAMADAFPVEDFLSENCLKFCFAELSGCTPRKVFSNVLRFVCKLMRASDDARNWFLGNGVLGVIQRFPDCQRIPHFLETVLLTGPVPPDAFAVIHGILVSLYASDSPEMVINVLKTVKNVVDEGIALDVEFLREKFDQLVASGEERVLIAVMQAMTVVPDVSLDYARHFVRIVAQQKSWKMFSHVLDLFLAKHEEWSGFADDELLQLVLMVSPDTMYDEMEQIARILVLYMDFGQTYISEAVQCIMKFIDNPDFGVSVIEQMIALLHCPMSPPEVAEFVELVDAVIDDLDTISDENVMSPLGDAASGFLALYPQWRAQFGI